MSDMFKVVRDDISVTVWLMHGAFAVDSASSALDAERKFSTPELQEAFMALQVSLLKHTLLHRHPGFAPPAWWANHLKVCSTPSAAGQ